MDANGSQSLSQPLLYTSIAGWFHLLTRPEDYAEEAGIFTRAIREALPEAKTVLELGSGGGNNAWHMQKAFQLTLSDLSEDMLQISRRLNPDLPHHQGDMRSLRLERTFDAVFIHDAVCYLTSETDLRRAFDTAFVHTRPGGVALVVPDHTRETYRDSTDCGGHDGDQVTPPQPGRALRYLEWCYDPDPSDTTYICDFAYLLREGASEVRTLYDRHILGLFPRAVWLEQLEAAGFRAQAIPYEHSEVEGTHEIFLGRKE